MFKQPGDRNRFHNSFYLEQMVPLGLPNPWRIIPGQPQVISAPSGRAAWSAAYRGAADRLGGDHGAGGEIRGVVAASGGVSGAPCY